jgi:hypothetical protein
VRSAGVFAPRSRPLQGGQPDGWPPALRQHVGAWAKEGGDLRITDDHESAEFPTSVKEVVTLLVKSRWSISTAIEVSFNRGMYAVSLAFQRRMQDPFPALFRITQQSRSWPCVLRLKNDLLPVIEGEGNKARHFLRDVRMN